MSCISRKNTNCPTHSLYAIFLGTQTNHIKDSEIGPTFGTRGFSSSMTSILQGFKNLGPSLIPNLNMHGLITF